jgi:hypothetical protein
MYIIFRESVLMYARLPEDNVNVSKHVGVLYEKDITVNIL